MGSVLLGINSAYHESAACLLQDGVPVAFAEEERFNRRKHGKPARVDNPDELPRQAIRFCLRQAGLSLAGVEAVGYSFNPPLRLRNAGLGGPIGSRDWGSGPGEELFQRRLRAIPEALAELAGADVSARFHWLDHHLCHAASAFLVSPFEEAAVLVVDGIGEFGTVWLGHGQGVQLRKLGELEYPHSLGFLWEKLAEFLGFGQYDACKVMGLAAYGQPRTFAPAFATLASSNGQGGLRLAADTLRFRTDDFRPLESLLGPRRRPGEPLTPRHADIAAALQKATDKALLELAAALGRRTGSRRLCLAGGVALNCVSNRVLQESGLFEDLYVQPAAHDAGTALGAAAWLWCGRSGGERRFVLDHPYLGPGYSDVELIAALEQSGVRYRRCSDPAAEAAALIAEGAVVGWFQGRMEVGPRALGNRSLLADARRAEMRAVLNQKVKHRESFQPFAPAVLAERAADWFRIPARSRSLDFMLFACDVRPERATRIPAVVHADGTSRIQTVRAETNPLFHRLIAEFERKTGVPLVLNTSFNDSEPIVCSPQDALRTFTRTRIDALWLGDFLVERQDPS
ncbi:MAG: carbamoyltransferase [Limisphaerales bacterium]